MDDVIYAMQQTTKPGGTASYVGENLGRPAAGKTGTSENFKSAWFDGYVPQLGTAVGMYRAGEDGEELQMQGLPGIGDITGGSFPARIWTAYMQTAVDGMDVEKFPEPAYINKDAAPPTTTAPPPPPPPPPPTNAPPSTTSEAPPSTTSEPPPSTTSEAPPTTQGPPSKTKTPPGRPTVTETPTRRAPDG